MHDILMMIKNKSKEEKDKLKEIVRNSVKQSGEQEIAKYIVDIYSQIQNTKN